MSAVPPSPARKRPPPPPPASGSAGDEFARLVEIMRVLRAPDGCPWDREQTLASLIPFVLEEAHEVVDAIERRDLDALRGEIGDLVFEGVFLAQLCADRGLFSMADALRAVSEKLVRRHPHVFESAERPPMPATAIDTPNRVVEQWEQIKASERAAGGRHADGVLDGIPRSMPALAAAHEIGVRAAAANFDWTGPADVVVKIEEEVAELRRAVDAGHGAHVAEELGDLLFALANLARKLGVEPESALRAANRKFTKRFAAMEVRIAGEGLRMGELTLEELERRWEEVKRAERGLPHSHDNPAP